MIQNAFLIKYIFHTIIHEDMLLFSKMYEVMVRALNILKEK